jgi:hypothetical protein
MLFQAAAERLHFKSGRPAAIVDLILNTIPPTDPQTRSNHHRRSLKLWIKSLSSVPENDDVALKRSTRSWPVAVGAHFDHARTNHERNKQRWRTDPLSASSPGFKCCSHQEILDLSAARRLPSSYFLATVRESDYGTYYYPLHVRSPYSNKIANVLLRSEGKHMQYEKRPSRLHRKDLVSLEQVRSSLSKLWFIFSVLLCSVVIWQSIAGHYGADPRPAWTWLSTSIMPTIVVIIGASSFNALNPLRLHYEVRRSFSRLAHVLSSFYLLLIALTIAIEPFIKIDDFDLMKMSNYWLAPIQTLVASVIGVLFFRARPATKKHFR